QQQQGYSFFFLGSQLAKTRIDVNIKQVALTKAMTAILADKDLDWYIEAKTIIIKRSERRQSDKTVLRSDASEQQQRTITGRVTDEEGSPLEGVTVTVKATTMATTTDTDGRYKIAIPGDGHTLTYTIVGFESVESAVGNRSS